ncbi:hypothetical protein H7691_06585 [Stenotrophomonas sp. CW117]|uniref:hypothetical protein n=1 Tax=Stenotrophomonas TaxID=40323 RepID=UPI00178190A7|nr:hypothetical protein [Stenotrophomonas sp. CW117]QOF99776.1 hypothetical protein H7691_06585 [Stenotrophomonas sp. CW117]
MHAAAVTTAELALLAQASHKANQAETEYRAQRTFAGRRGNPRRTFAARAAAAYRMARHEFRALLATGPSEVAA